MTEYVKLKSLYPSDIEITIGEYPPRQLLPDPEGCTTSIEFLNHPVREVKIMALETLKDVKEIGGFKVAELEDFTDKRPEEFIVVNHKNNGISFKIQDGPVKENGLNGCQVDTIIETAKIMLEGLNKKIPCKENKYAIECLDDCLVWLNGRRMNREKRGVEGTSND